VVKSTILLDDAIVGSLVCFGAADAREVGYWVGQACWGRGVATEALRLFLEQVPDRPLRAFVVPANPGSRRVLAKCGFVPDGEDGDHLVFVLAG
jgi:RimJ/RimL family protein N-acetyltransferase